MCWLMPYFKTHFTQSLHVNRDKHYMLKELYKIPCSIATEAQNSLCASVAIS